MVSLPGCGMEGNLKAGSGFQGVGGRRDWLFSWWEVGIINFLVWETGCKMVEIT